MLSVVVAAAVALQPARLRNAATTRLHAANIQYGDTGGAALVLDDLSVRRGPVELVSGATWTIMPGERWGIVGPNGAGKSTLLGAILGIHDMTTGHVAVKTDADVGYLEQTGVGGSDTSVRTEVMSRMGALAEAQKALTEATERVEGGDYSEEALEALGEAQTQFEEKGGYTAEETVSKVLGGLGFDVKKDLDRPCSDFSGGWQMRIALARLLLSGPDVLFLDEPTNHLDSAARAWLATYLASYEGTLVLVSHDTAMLKRACDSIAEITGDAPTADKPGSGRRLETYKSCSFDQWRQQRAERAQRWVSTYERQKEEERDLEDFIRRFGAKASKATQAKDREQKLKRLREEMVDRPPRDVIDLAATLADEVEALKRAQRDGAPEENLGDTVASPLLKVRGGPVLRLPSPPPCGARPVALAGADVGWPNEGETLARRARRSDDELDMDEIEDATVIVKNVDLTIEREMRLVVRGANGAGKSTLIKALAGAMPLVGGERIEDDRLALGYFRQDLSQELPQDKTALEVAVETARRDGDDMTSEQRVREVLGALGLKGEMALRLVGSLSGGEKARVALACFVLTPQNVLILDEPSNHLDVDTVAALAGGLNAFEGAIVVISHDRAFVEELRPTHVLTVADGAATLEKRELVDADWDVSSIDERGAIIEEAAAEPAVAAPVVVVEEDAATRKKRHNAPRRMAKLEDLIAEADAAIAAVDDDMVAAGADVGKAVDLQKRRDALQADLDGLWAEYDELDALLAVAA